MGKKLEKRNKINTNGIFYIVISLISVFAIGTVVWAYAETQSVNVAGDYNYYEAEGQPATVVTEEGENLGATPGRDMVIDSLEYGSGLSAPLNFTGGVTTTPGGLVKILNVSRNDMICRDVILRISKVDTAGGEYGLGTRLSFSVATSGSSTGDYGYEDSPGLIATTSVPTSTFATLSYRYNPGSSVGTNDAYLKPSTSPFIWKSGEFIVGTFDAQGSEGEEALASTTAYDGTAGRLYLDCFIDN
jgi:hypothetical protein